MFLFCLTLEIIQELLEMMVLIFVISYVTINSNTLLNEQFNWSFSHGDKAQEAQLSVDSSKMEPPSELNGSSIFIETFSTQTFKFKTQCPTL